MAVNERPISLREGKVFLDGVMVMDNVKCDMVFKPKVWSGTLVGQQGTSRRWIGSDVTGNITRRRSTPWLKTQIQKYQATGATPEFTIQGIMDDKNSDYFAANGSDTVTAVGCVITGDIPLFTLDTNGEVIEDNVAFGAHHIV